MGQRQRDGADRLRAFAREHDDLKGDGLPAQRCARDDAARGGKRLSDAQRLRAVRAAQTQVAVDDDDGRRPVPRRARRARGRQRARDEERARQPSHGV